MKGKWIWVIIGLLVLVLLYMLFKGQSGANKGPGMIDPSTGQYSPYGSGGNISEMLMQLEETSSYAPSASECRSSCRQICKVYPAALTCKERCECKRDCKSACASGLDYKNMFP